jgi:hypothetical protein
MPRPTSSPQPTGEQPSSRLFRLSNAIQRDPAIAGWMAWQRGELGEIARNWFETIRKCGEDVREVLHDGHPTACVADVAFAYVDTYKSHVNVGFFHGAEIPDPQRLLEGTGKFMRHVKVRPKNAFDDNALEGLIQAAYADVKRRMAAAKNAK